MVDQLDFICQPTRVSSQADWLDRLGIGELVEQGKAYWQANAARPDLEAMKMRSRVSEAEALCASNGLGNFKVLEWHRV
jgi:SAM-dependent MidA family methyltransferase